MNAISKFILSLFAISSCMHCGLIDECMSRCYAPYVYTRKNTLARNVAETLVLMVQAIFVARGVHAIIINRHMNLHSSPKRLEKITNSTNFYVTKDSLYISNNDKSPRPLIYSYPRESVRGVPIWLRTILVYCAIHTIGVAIKTD